MLMVYNGLKSELNILAKFVFIYEKEISQMKKCSDFKGYNLSAYSFFCDELQKKLKYSKTDDIDKVKLDGKYTLSFTKNSVLIVDFLSPFAQFYSACKIGKYRRVLLYK